MSLQNTSIVELRNEYLSWKKKYTSLKNNQVGGGPDEDKEVEEVEASPALVAKETFLEKVNRITAENEKEDKATRATAEELGNIEL